MSSSTPTVQKPILDQADETVQGVEQEGYAAISLENKLAFDPTKDLNLPASYEELNARFRRLQPTRSQENLN